MGEKHGPHLTCGQMGYSLQTPAVEERAEREKPAPFRLSPRATGPFVLASLVFKEHHYTFSLHLPQNPTHAKISLNSLGITKKVVVT